MVALRGKLFLAQPSAAFARLQILGSMSPLVVFLTSIPLAFISTSLALVWWLVGSVLAGFLLSRLDAEPPEDPA